MNSDARTAESDPRFQRSHGALVAAMLELAAARPAEQIPILDLTRRAGVSRSTFYRHSESPVQFLSELLAEDHQALKRQLTSALLDPTQEFADAWRRAYIATLESVEPNREIYRTMISAHSAVFLILNDSLTQFAKSVIESTVGGAQSAQRTAWIDLAASQQAGNVMALIQMWVLSEDPATPETTVDLFMTLAPPWQLAHRSEDGTVPFSATQGRRTRSN